MLSSFRQTLAKPFQWLLEIQPSDKYDIGYKEHYHYAATLVDYYNGKQPKTLKPSKDGKDFNITLNLARLVVDRSVSMLFGAGLEFDAPNADSKEWLDLMWDANKKDILLTGLGQNGATTGTPILKIIPDGVEGKDGTKYPRLIAINPVHVTIGTSPHDVDRTEYYVIKYEDKVNRTVFREITERIYSGEELPENDTKTWRITLQKKEAGKRWEDVNSTIWDHEYAPLFHTKNLPAPDVYGWSDIEDVLGLQNDYNQAFSNVNKILWYHGHPRLWVRGGNLGALVDWGPDKVAELKGEGAELKSIEMVSDLKASQDFISAIRRDLMDITRTTDVETIKEKAGELTNFGLRILFKDELAKNKTKQLLYGDLLTRVNQAVLDLAGKDADAGEIIWNSPLPDNEKEEAEALKLDMELGLVSKETMATKRGYVWEGEGGEKEKIANEKTAEGNVGGRILSDFLKGNPNQNNQNGQVNANTGTNTR